MMERKRKYYTDILAAITLIEEFVRDIKSFDAYISDMKTKSAVERQLVIVGEAVNNVRKIERNDLKNAEQIIAFRNRLVHSYDSIDDAIV